MSQIQYLRGGYSIEWKKKKASTAMTANTFASFSADGLVTPATATSTEIIGLLLRTITSADDDYASNTLVPVLVPTSGDTRFLASGEAHSCTEVMNGEFVDITDADTINGGANSLEVIKVEQYIDANTVIFSLSKKSGVAASVNAD
jgi:glutathionyl-hydroquinone reductase